MSFSIPNTPVIISRGTNEFNEYLKLAVNCFFKEASGYIEHNKDFDIFEYSNEASLCSFFVNGLVRNDGDKYSITAAMEYSTKRKAGIGRTDMFVRYKNLAIWTESKYDRVRAIKADHSEHWDIKGWLEWDKLNIYSQAIEYYNFEGPQANKTYENHYIMTLAFKLIDEDPQSFQNEAEEHLRKKIDDEGYDRSWYYSVGFFNPEEKKSKGIEVYGTVVKMT